MLYLALLDALIHIRPKAQSLCHVLHVARQIHKKDFHSKHKQHHKDDRQGSVHKAGMKIICNVHHQPGSHQAKEPPAELPNMLAILPLYLRPDYILTSRHLRDLVPP